MVAGASGLPTPPVAVNANTQGQGPAQTQLLLMTRTALVQPVRLAPALEVIAPVQLVAQSSPQTILNYNNNENREIPIEVAIGSKIKLDFTAFDVEYEANCGYDWVQVKDTDGSPLGNTASKKFCGTTLPPSLTSTGNKMTVVFRSDYDVVKKGFQATWEKVTGTVATSGVVTSSNYPNNYPHNQDNVKTTLTVAEGKKVQLTITVLNIEAGEGCPYDHLSVYDGTTLLKKICGTTLPETPLVTTSNVMTLSFKSDHSVSQKGFSAKWEQID